MGLCADAGALEEEETYGGGPVLRGSRARMPTREAKGRALCCHPNTAELS
jgi:hypothetical protein